MSLTKNVVANYFGQGWQALMGLVFVPLYITYLGIEAYGLIGIFALLQAWLALLDMGMKPALGREMARFAGGAHNAQSIRDLLRSMELIGIAIAGGLALGIWAASGWLASHWVTARNLPKEAVASAFAVMGLVTALRFIENIYVSSIVGLQRQLLQNTVTSIASTVRGLGAVALLAWVSPTIGAFFLWQGVISIITVAAFAGVVYRALPPAQLPARFSGPALIGIWRFAAGMGAITFQSLLGSQVDKILLSRLLTLESFGYYVLAGVVAGALNMLWGRFTTALYPRFTELATNGDEPALRALYHRGAQSVTVLMGSAALMLMLFGEQLLRLWTGNPVLAQRVAPVVAILALGTLFNGLMSLPYQLQLAHGWTSLTIKVNIVAVSLIVPAVLWVVPVYGAIGAAWTLVTTNAGYLVFAVPLMHRRLLPGDKWRWYSQDVAIPLAAAAGTALFCRSFIPDLPGRAAGISVMLLTSSCVALASALVAPAVRKHFVQYLWRGLQPLTSRAAKRTKATT